MSNPLITAAQLTQALSENPPPVILDVRWSLNGPPGRDGYLLGHLPGAVFLDIDEDLCGPPGPEGRHPLPDADALQNVLRAAGVNADSTVVVYDAGDNTAASRAWWTLRWAGHADVLVLDGGMACWLASDGPVDTAVPEPASGDITVRPGGMPVLDADGAARLASEGLLIDVRAPERFRGETEPIDPVAGHIPGAVNVPDAPNLAEGGGYRSPAELHARYAPLGAEDPDLPIGAYCGSGITATHTALAMTAAGLPTPAVYIGSWSNWITDPSRPVATGE
ncbi:sulfurtransferase [Phytomonospora sp. NPDC050363]|uniref:sulfurtransferase n=1 Tax=Phytomonospora sp. NPDC050363 TaxID=3155642 RepID=UPI0033D2AEB7